VFLLTLSVLAGIALAFAAALRQEKPAKYTIIGFSLNAGWFLYPLVLMAMTLVATPQAYPSGADSQSGARLMFGMTYGRYMVEEHPKRGPLFGQVIGMLGQLSRVAPVSRKNVVKFLGEPDEVTTSGDQEGLYYLLSTTGTSASETESKYAAIVLESGKAISMTHYVDGPKRPEAGPATPEPENAKEPSRATGPDDGDDVEAASDE
jgi:hypothetical protein